MLKELVHTGYFIPPEKVQIILIREGEREKKRETGKWKVLPCRLWSLLQCSAFFFFYFLMCFLLRIKLRKQ